MWGAFGNKPVDDDNCEVVTPNELLGSRASAIEHRARHPRGERRDGVRGRPGIPARPDVHQGRQVREAAGQKQTSRSPATSRCRLTLTSSSSTSAAARACTSSIARRSRSSATSSLRASIGPGHQIATDSKGNLYIAADRHGYAEADVQGDVEADVVGLRSPVSGLRSSARRGAEATVDRRPETEDRLWPTRAHASSAETAVERRASAVVGRCCPQSQRHVSPGIPRGRRAPGRRLHRTRCTRSTARPA